MMAICMLESINPEIKVLCIVSVEASDCLYEHPLVMPVYNDIVSRS